MRIGLNGGRFPISDRKGQKQKVFIEMLCDPDRTGLEGVPGDGRVPLGDNDATLDSRGYSEYNEEEDDDDDGDDSDDGNDDESDGDKDSEENDASLQFISYGDEENVGVLRLAWRTKWACEGMADKGGNNDDDNGGDQNKHWGLFTWFIIMWVFDFLYDESEWNIRADQFLDCS